MAIIGTKEVGAITHKQNGFICDIDENSIREGFEFYINNKEIISADTKNSALKFKEIMESLKF